ncbi:hypothetical protein ACIRSU_16440 [Streptomyces sp. NPDC101160]|uniref:hypothetical protein n=1 Tax=Streptomyces sp. NPDC101160 TaxID=3366118 RepID=UPI00381C43C6
MMTRIARVLAGTALVVTLAATAACGGGGGGDTHAHTPDTPDSSTTEPESDNTALFPGGGGQAAPAHVPTAKVHETKRVPVTVHNGTGKSFDMGPPSARPDDSRTLAATATRGTCTGTLPADAECTLNLEVTPLEAGPYSGELTVDNSAGETLTVPFSGEAVGEEPTETVSPTTETPLPTEPTPTETDVVPTESEPEPEVT